MLEYFYSMEASAIAAWLEHSAVFPCASVLANLSNEDNQ